MDSEANMILGFLKKITLQVNDLKSIQYLGWKISDNEYDRLYRIHIRFSVSVDQWDWSCGISTGYVCVDVYGYLCEYVWL